MKPTILIILLLTSSCAVSDWSARDKHLLAFSIAGTALDVATTDYAMDHGFKEVGIPRHVMGEHPGTTKLILTGVLSTVDELPFFLQAKVLKPYISKELEQSTKPVFYKTKRGKKGVGYDATLLPKVAEVYLRLRDEEESS